MQTDFIVFANKVHNLANSPQFTGFLILLVVLGIISLLTIDEGK
jgi:hypothetical protein